jgi:hypothetical protein
MGSIARENCARMSIHLPTLSGPRSANSTRCRGNAFSSRAPSANAGSTFRQLPACETDRASTAASGFVWFVSITHEGGLPADPVTQGKESKGSMAIKLSVSRTQWAVGNGFFHTGSVTTANSSVNFVYDCGALSPAQNQNALRREVDEHATRVDRVDFMFISHFDFDHVSGIPQLIRGVSVDRFIIPLVPESERLFILGGNVAGGLLDGNSEAVAFYDAFIIDPAAALTELTSNAPTPAEVQVIATAQAAPPSDDSEPPEILPPRELTNAVMNATLDVDFESARVTASSGADVVWEWFYYVAMQVRGAVSVFVDALLDQKLIVRESDLQDPSCVADLVRNHRGSLAKAYEAAAKSVGKSFNRNLTSLMLYSGPLPGAQHRAYRTRTAFIERAEIGAWNPRPGWLGLGDADLRSSRRVDEVNAAFHNRKPLVGTFAPSHHGSRKDWDASLMTGFDPNSVYSPTYVFGASGAYKSSSDNAVLHPDGDVILAINEAGGTAVTVGLSEASRWTESLSVFVKP